MYRPLPAGHMKRSHIRRLVCIVWMLVAFLWSTGAYASGANSRVRFDGDGDHRSDMAVARIIGSTMKIKVRLSALSSRVLLSADIRNEVGLQLSAYDVDNDSEVDLVLTNVISLRPVAIWLNKSNGRFERTSGWILPLPEREDLPHFRRRVSSLNDQAILDISSSVSILSNPSTDRHTLPTYRHTTREESVVMVRWTGASLCDRGPPAL
jgi:hypothetical protein